MNELRYLYYWKNEVWSTNELLTGINHKKNEIHGFSKQYNVCINEDIMQHSRWIVTVEPISSQLSEEVQIRCDVILAQNSWFAASVM